MVILSSLRVPRRSGLSILTAGSEPEGEKGQIRVDRLAINGLIWLVTAGNGHISAFWVLRAVRGPPNFRGKFLETVFSDDPLISQRNSLETLSYLNLDTRVTDCPDTPLRTMLPWDGRNTFV